MAPDLSRAAWRKSSYSGGEGGNCVELTRTATISGVRDSKNSAGPALVFDEGALHELLAYVKAGALRPHH